MFLPLLVPLVGTQAASLFAPALDRLPAGAIRPADGWLADELTLQTQGSTYGLGFWAGGGIAASKWVATTDATGGEARRGY